MQTIEAVDLFCGVGGLTAGLINAGVVVKAGYDIELECRYAYENNNKVPFIQQDVAELKSSDVQNWFNKDSIRLLAGCAPCQPFSKYNQGKDVTNDKKWPLLYHFLRLVREILPELVTMENVPEVIKHKVYEDFVFELKLLGYSVSAQEVLCSKYGIPQTRRRHVLLASRMGNAPKLLKPTHENPVTVREAIGGLKAIKAGEFDPMDLLHKSAGLNDKNMLRIKASKQGGTWRDWPEDLVVECHKKKSGRSYASVYGRMLWDEPAPTMTTLCYGYGNGRFGHPEQNRAISLREAAIIQSFPSDYEFCPRNIEPRLTTVGRMIGNAVPVLLGKVIGESFYKSLDETKA